MSHRRRWLQTFALFCPLTLPGTLQVARSQDSPAPVSKLNLRAALVLTPDFCATQSKKGDFFSGKETFAIGKAACAELEPALGSAFSQLASVEAPPTAGDAQAVLTPRFVDVGATKAMGAFSNRELVVLIEWTVKDGAGKTVWIETVQGSAKHHMGNMITHGKNVKLIVTDSIKDAARQSAAKMMASSELRKLSQ